MVINKIMVILALLTLTSCATAKISEPRFELPVPPHELTAPAPELKTIVPK